MRLKDGQDAIVLIVKSYKSWFRQHFNNLLTHKQTFVYLCAGVSLLRPAPLELPQGGNAARVEGCSGAIKVAYPFFIFLRRDCQHLDLQNSGIIRIIYWSFVSRMDTICDI